MRYLTYRRFNFMDAVFIHVMLSYMSVDNYISAALMCFGGAVLSFCLEIKVRENGQEIEA